MKVLIVDHLPIIQEILKATLSEVPQLETIGQAKG
jgi:chemotaxis response regulator CheB